MKETQMHTIETVKQIYHEGEPTISGRERIGTQQKPTTNTKNFLIEPSN